MKNQSGTIKTNLELDRVVMGDSGGYRRLPGGSAFRDKQTQMHHNIYIIIITIIIIIIIIIVDENIKDFIHISGHRWRCDPLWGFRPRPSCPDHTQYVRYQFCSDSFPTSF